MALLAESLVEEWLNRQGYFTIRGVKHGVDKMDLLAVRPQDSQIVGWHDRRVRSLVQPVPISERSSATTSPTKQSVRARPLRGGTQIAMPEPIPGLVITVFESDESRTVWRLHEK